MTPLIRKMLSIAIFGGTPNEREVARSMVMAQFDKEKLSPDFSGLSFDVVQSPTIQAFINQLPQLSNEEFNAIVIALNSDSIRRNAQIQEAFARQMQEAQSRVYNTTYGFRTTKKER